MGKIVSTSDLRVLNTTLDARFLKAFGTTPIVYPELTTEVPSSSTSNTYPVQAAFPQMREWVGERKYHQLAASSFVIANKHFELTMSVDADDIKDHGVLGSPEALMDSSALGERAKQHPDVLLRDILQTGQSLLCYDGQNFFDTDHPIDVKRGTGVQVNYESSGRALSAANWEYVRAIMGGYSDDAGEPIGVRPNILLVPTQLEGTARRILEAENDAAGATNVNRGTAKVVVWERLNNQATTWYALDTRTLFKPFIYQLREAVQFAMLTDVTSENVFRHRRFDYGIDGRWNVGVGAWFRAYKAVA